MRLCARACVRACVCACGRRAGSGAEWTRPDKTRPRQAAEWLVSVRCGRPVSSRLLSVVGGKRYYRPHGAGRTGQRSSNASHSPNVTPLPRGNKAAAAAAAAAGCCCCYLYCWRRRRRSARNANQVCRSLLGCTYAVPFCRCCDHSQPASQPHTYILHCVHPTARAAAYSRPAARCQYL